MRISNHGEILVNYRFSLTFSGKRRTLKMTDDYLLDVLEQRVYFALKKIADQQSRINTLVHEKKELEQSLSMHKIEIDRLKRELQKAESSTDAAVVLRYQEREAKLKTRLEELLNKIDKVGILE